jgi:hypothetical protein
LFNEQGLGIALFSYAGTLSWGIVGDWDLVPDLSDFADALRRAFYRLKRAGVEIIRDRQSQRSQGPARHSRRDKVASLIKNPRLASGH